MLLRPAICSALASAPRLSPPHRLPFIMAANGSSHVSGEGGYTLASLPKSWHFTASLPPDPLFPTPVDSHKTPRDKILPRQVRGALFTWVRPETQREPELLAVSPAAMRDLGLRPSEAQTDDFRQTAAGNKLWGWDEQKAEGGYPWAQCYGGFQFGQWAGQLGDGRAISLFETTNGATGTRYEVQLKGAGITPYSRFADGKAVLRSSIREFVVSEALNALGIPSTRALSLTLLPHSKVRRETTEPGAIVVRFAQSWLRLGNFDILRARGDRDLTRRLATYAAESVFGGWEQLPGRVADPDKPSDSPPPRRGVKAEDVEGPSPSAENRFARLFREVVRRNALTVAKWQAYGFMNGVLNTDNTSLMGLSIDFGPFGFMDSFDTSYTPNHDDHLLRYSYRNQPTIVWWNLVRFGEALGELLGAGYRVDDDAFIRDGVEEGDADAIVARAEAIIRQAGEEYKAVFLAEYSRLLAARLGLRRSQPSDFDDLFTPLLDALETLELDYPLFFRRLSTLRLADIRTDADRAAQAATPFGVRDAPAERRTVTYCLGRWRARIVADFGGEGDEHEHEAERIRAMKAVNPGFVPRGWVLDEVIRRVDQGGERDVLRRVMHMALHPFEDEWDGRSFDGVPYSGDRDEELRWTGDVAPSERGLQCSCSS